MRSFPQLIPRYSNAGPRAYAERHMAALSRDCAHWQLTEGKPAPEKPR
jgi:hypothetical protein